MTEFWTPRRRLWHRMHVLLNDFMRSHPSLPLRRAHDWVASQWIPDYIRFVTKR